MENVIKHMIDHSGKSQKEVAEQIYITPAYLNQMYKGKKPAHYDMVIKIADACGYKLAVLKVGD